MAEHAIVIVMLIDPFSSGHRPIRHLGHGSDPLLPVSLSIETIQGYGSLQYPLPNSNYPYLQPGRFPPIHLRIRQLRGDQRERFECAFLYSSISRIIFILRKFKLCSANQGACLHIPKGIPNDDNYLQVKCDPNLIPVQASQEALSFVTWALKKSAL